MKATTVARIAVPLVYVFFVPATGSLPLDGLLFVLLILALWLTYYVDDAYGGTR